MRPLRGFTLLELLIGMTLMGFVLALLFGGFRLATDTWDAVERRADETADEQLGRLLVRRMLTQMQPLRWPRAADRALAMSGDRQSLRAIAPVSEQAGAAGPQAIELRIEPGDPSAKGDGPWRLVLRHAPWRRDVPGFSENLVNAPSHVVLSRLDVAEFAYFGADAVGTEPRWREDWSGRAQLPRLVRVRLASRDAGWSDVTVAPLLNGERLSSGRVTAGPP